MDIKSAQVIARRYLAPAVVVILLSLGVVGFFVKEYKDLSKQKDELAEKVKGFGEDRLRYEHQRIEDERLLLARKAELDKREFLQQQYDAKYSENLAALKQRADEYSAAEANLRQTATLVSQSQRDKDAEERLQKVISEFSALGMDITSSPPCDPARRQRYTAAKAKYSEARALALASNLYVRYRNFFSDNETMMVSFDCKD